jgi:hypothetical protein
MAKSKVRRVKIYLRKDRRPAGPRKAASDAQRRQRHTPLRYPEPLTAEILAEENRRHSESLYYRLFNKAPVLNLSATEPWVRDLEFQAAVEPEIYRKLLAQESEFHNLPGRPKGSKTKNRRKPLKPEDEISKAAKRQRRSRLKKSVSGN